MRSRRLHHSTLCRCGAIPHLGRLGWRIPAQRLRSMWAVRNSPPGLVEPGGRVLSWTQVPTPADLDAEQLWRTLDALLTDVLDSAGLSPAGLAGCGCGCGGPDGMAVRAVVSPLNIPAWRGFPLRSRLAERLGGIPVRVHNDAICLVAAEHWRGAGRGRDNVLGMVVSTGVGGGLVLDGRLVDGASGNAGHIGHVVVEPDTGPECACGGRGCLEAIARGPALVQWAQAAGLAAGSAGRDGQGTGRRRRARPPCRPGRDAARRTGARHRHRLGDGALWIWRWSPSAAGCRRRGRCCSIRWRSRCGPTRGSASRGRSAWCRPRWAIAPGLVGAAALIFAADRYWAAD